MRCEIHFADMEMILHCAQIQMETFKNYCKETGAKYDAGKFEAQIEMAKWMAKEMQQAPGMWFTLTDELKGES